MFKVCSPICIPNAQRIKLILDHRAVSEVLIYCQTDCRLPLLVRSGPMSGTFPWPLYPRPHFVTLKINFHPKRFPSPLSALVGRGGTGGGTYSLLLASPHVCKQNAPPAASRFPCLFKFTARQERQAAGRGAERQRVGASAPPSEMPNEFD